MEQIIAQGQAIKTFWVAFACAVPFVLMFVLWAGLRLLDRSAGVRFADTVKLSNFNDALYFGMRWIGGCIVISAAMVMLGMVLAS
jgi:hypothetical protein